MTQSKRIAITGGSGKAGRWIIKHFLDEGYEVMNLDSRKPAEELCRTIVTDLTQCGQVINALSPYATRDRTPLVGVVHMAAIPCAHREPNDEVFRVNTLSTYNVLEACSILGIKKAVIASSESSYGICFASEFFEPDYLPVDEAHPQYPEDIYGLSKVVNEVTAETFHRRSGTQIISFRLGNILSPEDHDSVRETFSDPTIRQRILWSYIDARDVATACRLAIETDGLGCQPMVITADETSSDLPSTELIAKLLPGVSDLRTTFEGRASLMDNRRAKHLLKWEPVHKLAVES